MRSAFFRAAKNRVSNAVSSSDAGKAAHTPASLNRRAQHQRAGHDGHHAPADGGDGGFHRAVHGAQVARRHDVEPRKEVAHKVQPHPMWANCAIWAEFSLLNQRHQGSVKPNTTPYSTAASTQRRAAAQQQQLSGPGLGRSCRSTAHQRLCALRHTVEDGRDTSAKFATTP